MNSKKSRIDADEREQLLAEATAHIELAQWFGVNVYRLTSQATESTATPVRPVAPTPSPPQPGEDAEKRRRLDELCRAIENCHQCPLGETRTRFVFGTGRADARLVFVGEAPGQEEDLAGEPFVGRAGQLLTRMIVAMGLRREAVYIGNILKCRPPENRTPTLAEMAICLPYILQQIDIIQPEIVCALGATALKGLLRDPQASISRMRGKFLPWRGLKLMPTYHPAYLLRSPGEKRKAWEDLQKIMAELGLTTPER